MTKTENKAADNKCPDCGHEFTKSELAGMLASGSTPARVAAARAAGLAPCRPGKKRGRPPKDEPSK